MPTLFEKLTAAQLGALSIHQTVFFFPVGPLEDHGPHLPLDLDLREADRMCWLAAERLEKEQTGWTGVVMPRAPLGIDGDTTKLALTVRPHVLRDWLVDACSGLYRAGFHHFVCFSGHLGPRQLTAIEDAAKQLRRRGKMQFSSLFKDWSRVPVLVSACSGGVTAAEVRASPLWPDPTEHAGKRDTSVALHIAPDRVGATYAALPAMAPEASRWERLVNRLRRRTEGYWGSPGEATAEAGARELDQQLERIWTKLRAVWDGGNPEQMFRSWYSILPPNKSFFVAWALSLGVVLIMALWVYFTVISLVTS
jgi:creatinine amidohydrolase